MPKETNQIASNVITAVATAAIMGVFAWLFGVFEKGSDAIDKEQIRTVLQEELKTDAGLTYSARLNEVGLQVTVLETRTDALRSDVEDLEDIALDLAGGN